MFKKILAVLLVVVIGILGMAAMKPDTFAVTRSITIKAPPDKILGMVGDFRQWQAWSPWEGLDPQMQRTFSGPASGKGAVYQWSGNKEVGQGRMEVSEVIPASKVVIKLDFITPFQSSNMTEFSTVPQGDATNVTWTMTGPMPFISKVMSVFISMDSMIGKDFEKGLAKLKAAAEA